MTNLQIQINIILILTNKKIKICKKTDNLNMNYQNILYKLVFITMYIVKMLTKFYWITTLIPNKKLYLLYPANLSSKKIFIKIWCLTLEKILLTIKPTNISKDKSNYIPDKILCVNKNKNSPLYSEQPDTIQLMKWMIDLQLLETEHMSLKYKTIPCLLNKSESKEVSD